MISSVFGFFLDNCRKCPSGGILDIVVSQKWVKFHFGRTISLNAQVSNDMFVFLILPRL